MNEPPVLLIEAQLDYFKAYERYGERFDGPCEQSLELLRNHHLIGRVFRRHYRRLLIPKTPFGIFYTVEGERVMVGAILDLRQDPRAILKRLGLS